MRPLMFTFTPKSALIPIPVVINEEWISTKQRELKSCFDKLNAVIRNIDSSTLQGKADLKTALDLSSYYIDYRIRMNNAVKGFYGRIEKDNKMPAGMFTSPMSHKK